MTRTIDCYYNLARRVWCNRAGGTIPERQWPYVNLWETPKFVIGLLDDDLLELDGNGIVFTTNLLDLDNNIIATVSSVAVSQAGKDERRLIRRR